MSNIQYLLVVALATACGRGTSTSPARPGVPRSPPGLSAHVLITTIRSSYLSGLRRCYARQLKLDPRVRGLVTVSLTVDGTGRLSARRAAGVGRRLEGCVEQQMTRWKFPPATTEAGRPSEQRFILSLQLSPP